MPKQAREDMLRQWAKLAPEECWEQGAWFYAIKHFVYPVNDLGVERFDDKAKLLLAVIEAVRARGWVFDLDVQGEVSLATVTHNLEDGLGEVEESGEDKEPCDAALRAYVRGLKTVSK